MHSSRLRPSGRAGGRLQSIGQRVGGDFTARAGLRNLGALVALEFPSEVFWRRDDQERDRETARERERERKSTALCATLRAFVAFRPKRVELGIAPMFRDAFVNLLARD